MLKSLQKKECPEHARLIRCTCVETSSALRDVGRGPIELVYRWSCRLMYCEVLGERCAVGRLAVRMVFYFS